MPYRYIAGYLDADGSIQMLFVVRRIHQFRVRTFVSFYGTNKETMDWIGEHLGKKPVIRKPTGLMKTTLWQVVFSDRDEIRNVLQKLMPFMIGKKHHAEIVLEALDILEERKWGEKHPLRIRELLLEISKLQIKGGAKTRKDVSSAEYDMHFETQPEK